MSDFRYYVKYKNNEGETCYGIAETYNDEAKRLKEQGLVLVADAVLPIETVVPESKLVDIKSEFGRYDQEIDEYVDCDEYTMYVQGEFKKAQKISDNLPDGVHVGALFSVSVADGQAWYVVTKVGRKNCDIEWRGFCLDRYSDHFFGWGRKIPVEDALRYVSLQRSIRAMFLERTGK